MRYFFHVAVLSSTSAYTRSFLGWNRGKYLNFSSIHAKLLYCMNLKPWSSCSFPNGSVRIRTRVFVLFRNSMGEGSFSHILQKRMFQCLKVLKTFSQSVSSCGLIVLWSLHQRIYFFRSHSLHNLIIFCLRKLSWSFIRLETKLFIHISRQLVRRYWADLLSESFDIRTLCSKCMVSLLFFLFRIPRAKRLTLLNTGWPDSWNRFTIWVAVESHFPSGRKLWVPYRFNSHPSSKDCPVLFARISSRNSWLVRTLKLFVLSSLFFVHSRSSNIDMNIFDLPMRRFNVLILQIFLDLLEYLQRRESWNIFHCNSSGFSSTPNISQ